MGWSGSVERLPQFNYARFGSAGLTHHPDATVATGRLTSEPRFTGGQARGRAPWKSSHKGATQATAARSPLAQTETTTVELGFCVLCWPSRAYGATIRLSVGGRTGGAGRDAPQVAIGGNATPNRRRRAVVPTTSRPFLLPGSLPGGRWRTDCGVLSNPR